MHEMGHQFDSYHTHDYSPAVDTCGTSCSPSLPLGHSATIMSYCHQCPWVRKMSYRFMKVISLEVMISTSSH